jgi:hypothetical protein
LGINASLSFPLRRGSHTSKLFGHFLHKIVHCQVSIAEAFEAHRIFAPRMQSRGGARQMRRLGAGSCGKPQNLSCRVLSSLRRGILPLLQHDAQIRVAHFLPSARSPSPKPKRQPNPPQPPRLLDERGQRSPPAFTRRRLWPIIKAQFVFLHIPLSLDIVLVPFSLNRRDRPFLQANDNELICFAASVRRLMVRGPGGVLPQRVPQL